MKLSTSTRYRKKVKKYLKISFNSFEINEEEDYIIIKKKNIIIFFKVLYIYV